MPAPSTPSNLTAVPVVVNNTGSSVVSPTQIALFWDGVSDGETSITLVRSTTSGSGFQTLVVLGSGENVYMDRSCAPSTTYYYEIFASNASGNSANSSQVSATTGAAYSTSKLADPTGLTVTANTVTTVNVSFTDNGASTSSRWYWLERQILGTLAFQRVTWPYNANGGTVNFIDYGLQANTTYTYRLYGTSTQTTYPSNYTGTVSVTTTARTAGFPVEPSNVLGVPAGPTSITVTWADTNASTAQYEVSMALWNASLSNAYSVIATTSTGATTYTITGLTAETPYLVRVRAKNATGFSDYGVPLHEEQLRMHGWACATCTSSVLNGTGTTYNVGPGQTYTTPGAFFNAITPGPGDTINLYPTISGSSVVPYTDCILLGSRGTPLAPITYQGQPDPTTGLYPVFNCQFGTADTAYAARAVASGNYNLGAFWIGKRANATYGFNPGYIVVKNIEFSGAYSNATSPVVNGYVTVNGVQHSWGPAAGIYIEACENLTIQNCTVDNNGDGIFGAGHPAYDRALFDVQLLNNSIYNNSGTNGSVDQSHNSYMEGIRVTYQGNNYGPIRTGGLGNGLKDRSPGPVVRCNYVGGGGALIEHCEPQNQSGLSEVMTSLVGSVHIYENILYTSPGSGASAVWGGGDQGLEQISTQATYYVYHNTCVIQNNQTAGPNPVFKVSVTTISYPSELLDARNNVFNVFPQTTGQAPSQIGVSESKLNNSDEGNWNGYLGGNWVNPNYVLSVANSNTFTGHAQGTANLILGATTNPGFVSQSGGNYELASGSVCLNAGTPLPGNVLVNFNPSLQYVAPQSTTARAYYGSGANLGAFQPGGTPFLIQSAEVFGNGRTLVVTFAGPNPAQFGVPDWFPGAASGVTCSLSGGVVLAFRGATIVSNVPPIGNGTYTASTQILNSPGAFANYVWRAPTDTLGIIATNINGSETRAYIAAKIDNSNIQIAATPFNPFAGNATTIGTIAMPGGQGTQLIWRVEFVVSNPAQCIDVRSSGLTFSCGAGLVQDVYGNSTAAVSNFPVTINSLVAAATGFVDSTAFTFGGATLYVVPGFGSDTNTFAQIQNPLTPAATLTRACTLAFSNGQAGLGARVLVLQGTTHACNAQLRIPGAGRLSPFYIGSFWNTSLAAYGTQGVRPIIQGIGNTAPIYTSGGGSSPLNVQFQVVQGLELQGGVPGAASVSQACSIGRCYGPQNSTGYGIVFDDVKFNTGILGCTVEGEITGGTVAAGLWLLDRIMFNRCSFLNTTEVGTSESQGLFVSSTTNLLFSQCVWNFCARQGQTGAGIDLVSHPVYGASQNGPIIVWNAYLGWTDELQLRAGGTITDIVRSECTLGDFLGGAGGRLANYYSEYGANGSAPVGSPNTFTGATYTHATRTLAATNIGVIAGGGSVLAADFVFAATGTGVVPGQYAIASGGVSTNALVLAGNGLGAAADTAANVTCATLTQPRGYGPAANQGSDCQGCMPQLYELYVVNRLATYGTQPQTFEMDSQDARYLPANHVITRNLISLNSGPFLIDGSNSLTPPLLFQRIQCIIDGTGTPTDRLESDGSFTKWGFFQASNNLFASTQSTPFGANGANYNLAGYKSLTGQESGSSIQSAPIVTATADSGAWAVQNGIGVTRSDLRTYLAARPLGVWGNVYDMQQAVSFMMGLYQPAGLPPIGTAPLNFYGVGSGADPAIYPLAVSGTAVLAWLG